jgi:RHS repeat-associated protein
VPSNTGAFVEETKYSNYGTGLNYSGGISPSELSFTGHHLDAETGLVYANARYYSPKLGRFVSSDFVDPQMPVSQSLNRFAYGNNDPTMYFDPSGNWSRTSLDGHGAIDVNLTPDAYDEASAFERPKTLSLILVGEPGLGEHGGGANFRNAGSTKQAELQIEGHDVDLQFVGSDRQFLSALKDGAQIDGQVHYFGHSEPYQLYIGESAGEHTNLTQNELAPLTENRLGPNAVLYLNSCNAGLGIAQKFADTLGNPVMASRGGIEFAHQKQWAPGPTPPKNRLPVYPITYRRTPMIIFVPVTPKAFVPTDKMMDLMMEAP